MRCGFGRADVRASRRARVSARCEPRLSSAMAWISSTMTVRAVRSISRDFSAVSRMKSDSGVVTRMCGGCLPICWRSEAGVSPVRTAVRMGASGIPLRCGQRGDFGERGFEIPVDVVAERLERRDVDDLRFRRQAGRRARRGPGGRGRSERRRASCRSRWARR